MGLNINHLSDVSIRGERSLYLYLLNYGWPDGGICQTSCPLISCGVSDFRGAVFVFGVEPDWSSRLPVSGFA